MHRVHHSVEDDETNANFGFNLPWWDRLFGTYRAQPRAGHDAMIIGIHGHTDPREVARLDGMLLMPFKGEVDATRSTAALVRPPACSGLIRSRQHTPIDSVSGHTGKVA